MKRIIIVFFMVGFSAFGQDVGIKFVNNLGWKAIKEKAKKENKYIFVDAYTTWCVPCKQMSVDVFSLAKVGSFFNGNFVNVALQFDVTKKDNEEIKRSYKDVSLIKSIYEINSYPTYLFFNPDGELVHVINGAILKPEEFINKAKEALEPEKQLFTLKRAYNEGKRTPEFLYSLINTAKMAGDYLNLPKYVNTYLSIQKDGVNKKKIEIAALGLNSKNDIAFQMIMNNPELAITVLGRYKRAKLLSLVVFNEELVSQLRINGKVNNLGTMITYEGKINPNVDWPAIKEYLNIKYKDIANFIYTDAKLSYFMWLDDWKSYNQSMSDYVAQKKFDIEYVSNNVSYLIAFSEHPEDAIGALQWAQVLLTNKDKAYYLKDYSCLLYQAKKNNEAIALMQEYVDRKDVKDNKAIENIEKMKKGEEVYW